MHPKDQHQPQGSPDFKGWDRIQTAEAWALSAISVFWQSHPLILTFNQMEDTSRQQDNKTCPFSLPLLLELIWIYRDQCFPGWLPTLAHWVGVPIMAGQGTMKTPHTFQLHKEPRSSLSCHMALLLIPWQQQGCWGWVHGFSSLSISLARAHAEVLVLM